MDLFGTINTSSQLRGEINKYGRPSDEQVQSAVNNWLDNHPEATTTVADHSITKDKLIATLASEIEGDTSAIGGGNLNQKVKINPFVLRTSSDNYGTIRVNRTTAVVNNDGSMKLTPTASTAVTDGFWVVTKNSSSTPRKIYVSCSGLTTTRPDFTSWRIFISQSGTTIPGAIFNFIGTSGSAIITVENPSASYDFQVNFFEVGSLTISPDTFFTIGSMQIIDLTEMFGAGYEPSLTEFEEVYGSLMPYAYRVPAFLEDLNDEKALILSASNKNLNYLISALPRREISGQMASFRDGADDIPVKDAVISINPIQAGSGDPSPDNVRQISGWTGAHILKAGKNLLPNKTYESGTVNGLTYVKDADGSIVVNGTATNAVSIFVCRSTSSHEQYFPLASELKNGEYILSGCPSGGSDNTYRLILNRNNDAQWFKDLGNGVSFTKTDDFINIDVYLRFSSGVTVDNLVFRPMIRVASETDASYELYKAEDANVSWQDQAGVIYGGTLDLNSGMLTVTKAKVVLGDLTWYKGNRGNLSAWFYYATGLENIVQKPAAATGVPDIICTDYKTTSSQTIYNIASGDLISITAAGAANPGRVWVMDSRHISGDLTGDQFKALLESSGAEMVYELANPLTYRLSPTQIKTFFGINNIWSDAGNISIEYCADTKLYIEELTNPSEDDLVANQNINANKYFMVGNALYFSTTAISSGETISAGTNCRRVSLADALNELNN